MNDLTKQNENLPAFMQGDDLGTENLERFIHPPRLKVVQAQSDADTFDEFDAGEVVALPQLIKVAGMASKKEGEMFTFIPLFFFPQWVLWNPLELKGSIPAIRDMSNDPESEIARRAQNPATWAEPCPENPDYKIRYCEHLNYVVLLEHPELAGIPVLLTWSRAGHRQGTNFAGLIKMRRAPMYGCRFEARSVYTSNQKGQWYSLQVRNPSDGVSLIQNQDVYEELKAEHRRLKKAHKDSLIVVDYNDDSEEVSAPDTDY